jgi:hypothetical protein
MGSMSAAASDTQLQEQIGVWEKELEGWRADKLNLERRIATRERLLRTLREEADLLGARLFSHSAAPEGSRDGMSRPGTSKAIIAVLEDAERALSASEVYDELQRRGWLPLDAKHPRNAVRAGLWTLAKNEKIARLGETPALRRWAAKTSTLPVHAPQEEGATG